MPGRPQKRVSLPQPSLRASFSTSPIRDASVDHGPSTPVDVDGRQESDPEEQEENETLIERIMAVDMRDRGSIGCCYYVAANEALYLLEDVKSGGLEIIDLREHVPKQYKASVTYIS